MVSAHSAPPRSCVPRLGASLKLESQQETGAYKVREARGTAHTGRAGDHRTVVAIGRQSCR